MPEGDAPLRIKPVSSIVRAAMRDRISHTLDDSKIARCAIRGRPPEKTCKAAHQCSLPFSKRR
ncbi:hypothetical protein GCM10027343_19260 [Noviherbaspirillum agri]